MKIIEMFQPKKPLISFEFFPPKSPKGMEQLQDALAQLKELSPSYVSMTYGAGGSTREKTIELVSLIKHKIRLETMAHLTCVGHTREELTGIIKEFEKAGIENIMALRGDPPKGETEFQATKGGFHYASELVKLIRDRFDFCLGVAGYPEKHIEASSMEKDLQHLKQKITAGGDFIVTQLFFDNADYFSFVDRARALGIKAPIVAGIMPIKDSDQIKRFASMCGARIPDGLLKKLEAAGGDREKVVQIGIEHAISQCEDLIQKGVPGIHFYTLNNSHSTRKIFEQLRNDRLV